MLHGLSRVCGALILVVLLAGSLPADENRFIILSDLHPHPEGFETLAKVTDNVLALDPAFVIVLGDIGGDESPGWSDREHEAIRAAFERMTEAGIDVYPVMGNHDIHERVIDKKVDWFTSQEPRPLNPLFDEKSGGEALKAFREGGPFNYSFTRGGLHFAILDSNVVPPKESWEPERQAREEPRWEAQRNWMVDNLCFQLNNPEEYPTLVFLHHPEYMTGDRGMDSRPLFSILSECDGFHSVEAVFGGHWHEGRHFNPEANLGIDVYATPPTVHSDVSPREFVVGDITATEVTLTAYNALTGQPDPGGVDCQSLQGEFEPVQEEADQSVRMKNGYPLNLIYGAGHLEEMGCPMDEQPECYEEVAGYLYEMGARTTRKTISWLHTEREQGTYDWTRTDNSIPALVDKGFSPVALISDTPEWASHPDARRILEERGDGRFVVCLEIEEEHWDDYETWLTEAVRRYGEDIDYYEIMNEPDGMCGMYPKYWKGDVGGVGVGGRPEYYAEILKRSAKVIRREDPTAKVAVGGFENKRGLQTAFVEGIYEHGAQPYFDAIAIHPYGQPFEEPFSRKWMATVREVMEKHGDGDKPFWITEYNNEGRGELDMSFTVRRKHRLLRETPWIVIAIPLGTKYYYYGEDAVNWPLRAIQKMEASEFAPRSEWSQDFQAPTLDLLANWEWRVQPVDDHNWPEVEIEQETGVDFSTGLHIEGHPTNKKIRAYFLPYVMSDDPTIEVACAIDPATGETVVHLKVGVETLDVLEPVQESDYVKTVTEFNRFQTLSFKVRDHFPDLADKGLNMFWVEFESPDPGFSVRLDNVRVY